MMLMKMKKQVKLMNKIFKPLTALFKAIYYVIDKFIVMPVSRVIYRIGELNRSNSGRFEKLLNRPNILIYVSLFCAIAIFVLIDTKAITLVTSEAEIIPEQPVKIIYNQEAYVVEGVPESVDITLIGRKSDLYLAKQLGEHQVVLDLSGYSEGTHKVKLKYNHSIESVDYKLDPSTITVKISEKISANKTLDIDLLNEDKLDVKLSIKSVKLDRDEVIVKGSEEALASVAKVKALIDLKAADLKDKGEFTVNSIILVAYDNNGIKINNVEIVPTKVSATVVVDAYSVDLPVKIVANGKLTVGYAIASAPSSVERVKVYGDPAVLDKLGYIEAPIDIEGLNTNKTFKVTLVKPSGVRYMSETTTSITVTLERETSKEFSGIQVESINVGANLSAGAAAQGEGTITVIAKGVASVIEKIEAKSIKATIDLSGYAAGTYDVPIILTIDDVRVNLTPQVTTVKVRITAKG